MPLGVLSNDDFEREFGRSNDASSNGKESHIDQARAEIEKEKSVVDRPRNEPHDVEIVEEIGRGRKAGDTNVPNSLRALIGETSVIDGREAALQFARDFGISPSSVSAYAKGATSTKTYDTPKPSIISHINKSRARVVKRATSVLNSALGAISQEKLDYADPDKLSGIAKDMSVIIKNMEPKEVSGGEDGKSSSPQFVIFAPQFRDERTFEHIEVKE